MANDWWTDDDRLMASLADAVRAADATPRAFVEASKDAYTWHNIDAELAALTHDSAVEEDYEPAATRDEPAQLRNLTFATAELTIELELTNDSLLGQVVPPQPGEVRVLDAFRRVAVAPVDDLGCFIIRPVPAEPFRLHVRAAQGPGVLTGWIAL